MTGYPGRVRIADPKHEEELMELCRQLHKENGIFSLNEDKVRDTLHMAFNRKGAILGVIGEPGKFEAIICMLVSSFWYSNDPHIEELFAFVVPEYRKSKNAVELMEFARWCTDSTGFPLLMGVISNERTEGKVRLYQRKLGTPIGSFFFYKKKEVAA